MRARLRRRVTAEHACELVLPRRRVELANVGLGAACDLSLLDVEVVIRECGNLRQVGHAQHLAARIVAVRGRDRPDLLRHDLRGGAPDPRVDLVEHVRGHLVRAAQRELERQHDARQLASRGHLGQRTGVLALVGGEHQLHPIRPGRAQGAGLDHHRQARRAHAELGQRGADLLLELLRRLLARDRQRRGGRHRRDLRLAAGRRELREPRVATRQRIELRAQLRRLGDHRVEPGRPDSRGRGAGPGGTRRPRRGGVLANEAAHEREPLVEVREPLGVTLELVRVRAQLVRDVIDERLDLGELTGEWLEAPIDPQRALHRARRHRHAVPRTVIAPVQ